MKMKIKASTRYGAAGATATAYLCPFSVSFPLSNTHTHINYLTFARSFARIHWAHSEFIEDI